MMDYFKKIICIFCIILGILFLFLNLREDNILMFLLINVGAFFFTFLGVYIFFTSQSE